MWIVTEREDRVYNGYGRSADSKRKYNTFPLQPTQERLSIPTPLASHPSFSFITPQHEEYMQINLISYSPLTFSITPLHLPPADTLITSYLNFTLIPSKYHLFVYSSSFLFSSLISFLSSSSSPALSHSILHITFVSDSFTPPLLHQKLMLDLLHLLMD